MTRIDWYTLSGRSMWPLGPPVEAGIGRTSLADLRRGDLVALVGPRPGHACIHRVIAIAGDRVETRGDTRESPDPPTPASAILGRVVCLRLGSLSLPVPTSGFAAKGLRAAGLAWGRIAPHLRRLYRTARKY